MITVITATAVPPQGLSSFSMAVVFLDITVSRHAGYRPVTLALSWQLLGSATQNSEALKPRVPLGASAFCGLYSINGERLSENLCNSSRTTTWEVLCRIIREARDQGEADNKVVIIAHYAHWTEQLSRDLSDEEKTEIANHSHELANVWAVDSRTALVDSDTPVSASLSSLFLQVSRGGDLIDNHAGDVDSAGRRLYRLQYVYCCSARMRNAVRASGVLLRAVLGVVTPHRHQLQTPPKKLVARQTRDAEILDSSTLTGLGQKSALKKKGSDLLHPWRQLGVSLATLGAVRRRLPPRGRPGRRRLKRQVAIANLRLNIYAVYLAFEHRQQQVHSFLKNSGRSWERRAPVDYCQRLLQLLPDCKFEQELKVSRRIFQHLVRLLRIEEERHPQASASGQRMDMSRITVRRLEVQLAIVLNFLATRDIQRRVANFFQVSPATVSRSLTYTIPLLFRVIMRTAIVWPQGDEDLDELSNSFLSLNTRRDVRTPTFQGVIGAIDGTHVNIRGPLGNTRGDTPKATSLVDRHGSYSLAYQVVCDSHFRVIHVGGGEAGGMHDVTMFKKSDVPRLLESLPADYHLLGDKAYVSTATLIAPFKKPFSTQDKMTKRNFNFVHSSMRMVVECTIGIVKRRFPRLCTDVVTDIVDGEQCPRTLLFPIACGLHNLIMNDSAMYRRDALEQLSMWKREEEAVEQRMLEHEWQVAAGPLENIVRSRGGPADIRDTCKDDGKRKRIALQLMIKRLEYEREKRATKASATGTQSLG